MAFYYLVFFLFYLFSLLEILGLRRKQSITLFFILSFFIYILSFIRWETGTDWYNYKDFFDHPTKWFEFGNFEPGYSTLNTFASYLFGDYTYLLFLLSSILYYFQTKTIYRLSALPLTSLFVLIGIYFGNINYIRQNIAICILFYSIIFIQRKDFIRFIIYVGIASMIHLSSIIFIFAWWIYYYNFSKRFMIVTILCSIFFSSFMFYIMTRIGSALGGIVEYKLQLYLSESDSSVNSSHSYMFIIIKGIANKCFVFIIALLFYDKIKEKYPNLKNYLNLYWFGIILYFSFISVSIVLVRFSFPYDFIQVILFPLILDSLIRKSNRIICFNVLSLYLVLRLYIYITSYYELYVPFKTILN